MKKSFMTRVLAVSLSAAMAFSLSSATSLTAPEAAAKKLPANAKKASISLKVGKSKTLKLKSYAKWNITKAASNKKAVATAKLNKKAKATVKVTAKKKGTAVVTLTLKHKTNAKDPIKKKVTVKVTKAATTDTTPTDTTPTDTTPTDTTTPTDSAVKVTPGALNIASVTATKVDVLTVSFSSVVASTSAVKFTVTKNESTTPVETKDITWNADANTATITMVAKMTKGTYKVSATDGKDTTEGTAEVTDQEVKEIKFLNETALTGKYNNLESGEAYVYYDVLDQYGESMKETVSIKWSPSTGVTPVNDRSKGRLTLRRSDSKDFTYGEKIYVTGVYTKTGVTNSGTFSVGTSQSIDTIKYAGFLKKGTTTILEKLPASFKDNQYLVLYTPYDQNGCELDADTYIDTANTNIRGNLTFISDNVLVIDKVTTAENVTVNGTEYCAGNVVPGTNVNIGGTLNLTAISTKTGQKSVLNTVVGAYKILKKFEMGVPNDVVADGEDAEIPFTATDEEGNKLTNFVELATQSDFSKVSFVAGVGSLTLEQKADGSAKLVWKDNSVDGQGKWGSTSEDGIDRPVSLTSVVVGGETSNQMIYVSDRARPDAIADVDIDSVMVNGSQQKIQLNNFTFLDQYGRNMVKKDLKGSGNNGDDGSANNGIYYDNGFFKYANKASGNFSGSTSDFSGYTFGVAVEASGVGTYFTSGGSIEKHPLTSNTSNICTANTTSNTVYQIVTGAALSHDGVTNSVAEYDAFITGKQSGGDVTLKFYINKQKFDGSEAPESVSTKVNKTVRIAKISELSNFTVADVDKFKIFTAGSDYETFMQVINDQKNSLLDSDDLLNGTTGVNTTKITAEVTKSQEITVKGTYNGTTITIPKEYYDIRGDKLYALPKSKKVDKLTTSALQWSELYDITSAQYVRKDASDKLNVTVFKQAESSYDRDTTAQTVVKKTVYISDAPSYLKDFVAADSVTVSPKLTTISMEKIVDARSNSGESILADAATDDILVIKDQYGEELYKNNHKLDPIYSKDKSGGISKNTGNIEFTYLVKDVQENEDGFVKNNFKIYNNSQANACVVGAELGDTFILEITAKCKDDGNVEASGSVTKTVKVTVGADEYSKIENSENKYAGVSTMPTNYDITDTSIFTPHDNNGSGKYGVEVELKYQVKQLYAK